MRSLRQQTDLGGLINWRKLFFCYVIGLFGKMFLLRLLWSYYFLSKMGHPVSSTVLCRWIQGIHENICSCWHGLKWVGRIQRRDHVLHHLLWNMNCCFPRLEKVFAGYWSRFSEKSGRLLNHSSTNLNSLEKNGMKFNILSRWIFEKFESSS